MFSAGGLGLLGLMLLLAFRNKNKRPEARVEGSESENRSQEGSNRTLTTNLDSGKEEGDGKSGTLVQKNVSPNTSSSGDVQSTKNNTTYTLNNSNSQSNNSPTSTGNGSQRNSNPKSPPEG